VVCFQWTRRIVDTLCDDGLSLTNSTRSR
jgi:hypothetical protein